MIAALQVLQCLSVGILFILVCFPRCSIFWRPEFSCSQLMQIRGNLQQYFCLVDFGAFTLGFGRESWPQNVCTVVAFVYVYCFL